MQATFLGYCILRIYFNYLTLVINFEFCTHAYYFREPMELAMNFAAVAYLLDLDNIFFVFHFFKRTKIDYGLFEAQ